MHNAAQPVPLWVGWASRPSIQCFTFMDLNGDAAETDDCDPDTTAGGEADQDRRYFVHQDRNWNVVALTEYDDGAGTDGRVAERYAYTPYGEFVVLTGDGGSGELGAVRPTSPAGNLFAHQGLAFDQEKGSYQNRHRDYAVGLERFGQRDPLLAASTRVLYVANAANALSHLDPSGLAPTVAWGIMPTQTTWGLYESLVCSGNNVTLGHTIYSPDFRTEPLAVHTTMIDDPGCPECVRYRVCVSSRVVWNFVIHGQYTHVVPAVAPEDPNYALEMSYATAIEETIRNHEQAHVSINLAHFTDFTTPELCGEACYEDEARARADAEVNAYAVQYGQGQYKAANAANKAYDRAHNLTQLVGDLLVSLYGPCH